ncbi:MAG: c-type cytochrome [Planctomycetales bacterium]|nr:c-type cytochrome [Planctomycetales bacterium]
MSGFRFQRSWAAVVAASLVFSAVAFLAALPISADESPAKGKVDIDSVVGLLELLVQVDPDSAAESLAVLEGKLRSGEINAESLDRWRGKLQPVLKPLLADDAADDPLRRSAAFLATYWRDPAAIKVSRSSLADAKQPAELRTRALDALISAGDREALKAAAAILQSNGEPDREMSAAVLASLARSQDVSVARTVLAVYPKLNDSLRPKAIELLTQRADWSKQLLAAISDKQIPAEALNANQVTRLQLSRDEELRRLVANTWGTVRQTRNPAREQVIAEMRELLARTPGDAERGEVAFHKLCGQCHKIHGRGLEVGPDITANGRNSYEQLLSNVFDPSLVIGAAYQPRVVITDSGRVLTGLLVEESDSRIVLKMQGGKQEVIPREDIDELTVSQLSMMPEGVEKQLTPQEIADLFAFLTLDRPPSDPNAQLIPGTPASRP